MIGDDMFRKIALCLLFCFYALYVSGREYAHIFRHYQVKDGLSDNLETAFIQDRHGFLWIGTHDGLNRFDGCTFNKVEYNSLNNKSPDNNRVNRLLCDKNEDLWAGTNSGLYKYNEKRDSFEIYPPTRNKKITLFQFGSQHNLWIFDNDTIIRGNIYDNISRVYMRGHDLSYSYFCITADDKVWTSDSNGYISYLNKEDGSLVSYNLFQNELSGQSGNIYQLYPSQYTSEIFVAYESDNLKLFDTSTLTYRDLAVGNAYKGSILINCLLEVNEYEMWIRTDIGRLIYKKDRYEWTKISSDLMDPYTILSHFVAEIYQDRENGIWIGYHQNGLSYYSPFNLFEVYYPSNDNQSIKGKVVHDIVSDESGTVWIATEDAGVGAFDQTTEKFTNYFSTNQHHSIAHSNIRGLGIYKYDSLSDKFIIVSDHIVGILHEDCFHRLWIGDYYCDLRNQKGNKWVFNNFELPQLNGSGEKYGGIVDLFCEENGDIWFLTGNGVLKYTAERTHFKWFAIQGQMPNIVFRILPDDEGHIWVSTAVGLICLDISDGRLTTYTEAHGVITRQFNYYAGLSASDGTLYFGTVNGLVHFDPKKIKQRSQNVNVSITSIETQGKETDVKNVNKRDILEPQTIELAHNQSTFNISFSTLSYVAPSATLYMYRLVGISNEWNNIGTRNTIYFTDLAPGKYTLEIRASDLSGSWEQSESLQLHILIRSAWWASTIAYSLYFILITGGAYLLVRYWLNSQKKSMAYKIRLFEHQKEKELYQSKIDFFITITHEIRTPLTLIKIPLEKLISDGLAHSQRQDSLLLIEKNVARLLELADQLLNFRKVEIEGCELSFVKVEIISLLTTISNPFWDAANENGLLFHLDMPVKELYVFVDKEAVTKILSNLFSNAIKYARQNISIHLSVSEDNESFVIDFVNDGPAIGKEYREKIFEPFYRIREQEAKPGTGLGLPLTRFLLEKHNGHIEIVESSQEKTVFRITLPVKQFKMINSIGKDLSANESFSGSDSIDPSRHSILITEDNSEMGSFISAELSLSYNVFVAVNGKEALQVLHNNNIQLVISDVLMPVIDGFELLKAMKMDLEFSHIPVILLTAKKTIQARLEGLELGADAYIDKPFSMDILLAQIANLLVNRENIRQFYFKSPIANMKSMAYSKADEEFLEKLNAIIDEHLSDHDFDVNAIAALFCMSRPTLYRKINAISNLTPHDLIRIARLKKAAELLLRGDLKIYEISEMVGFSSQSYFWSAFIKQFGMSPSKYAKANRLR